VTIRPGEQWGRAVRRPAGLRHAGSDAELAALLADGVPAAASGGDLARTLGRPRVEVADELREVPVDLMSVTVDGADPVHAVAHVVARSPWWRGSWWHGPVVVVMNAEFMGEWDVAPRGHPNDGRVETFEAVAGLGVRQRLACSRRLRSAGHVPHPGIATRSVRAATWTFDRPVEAIADGRTIGRGHRLEVAVLPDAAVLYT
jgi:hypothetical protein